VHHPEIAERLDGVLKANAPAANRKKAAAAPSER